MQTSFMHPPFGFALFYLRSVAPIEDYKDRVTGRLVRRVTTGQIYWGAVPFVLIQVLMVGLIIGFPGIVSRDLVKPGQENVDLLQQQVDQGLGALPPAGGKAASEPEDPTAAILRATEQEKKGKP
jgi:GntP family gluconate:H+ symporter